MASYTNEEIFAGLVELITDETNLSADQIELNKSFTDDLDIDSISMMTIVMNVEEKFEITVPEEKVKELTTVEDVVNFISSAE